MSSQMRSYTTRAKDDVVETVMNFKDEICESLLQDGKASDDLCNDYPNGDSWHNEHNTYDPRNLSDAADLLDELCEYEKTDNGLWDGQEPRQAICTQAYYTYQNAVMSYWRELIEEINDAWDGVMLDNKGNETFDGLLESTVKGEENAEEVFLDWLKERGQDPETVIDSVCEEWNR